MMGLEELNDDLRPVKCRCGGNVAVCDAGPYHQHNIAVVCQNPECGMRTGLETTAKKAVTIWNNIMEVPVKTSQEYFDAYRKEQAEKELQKERIADLERQLVRLKSNAYRSGYEDGKRDEIESRRWDNYEGM